jgi:hypothetical protein
MALNMSADSKRAAAVVGSKRTAAAPAFPDGKTASALVEPGSSSPVGAPGAVVSALAASWAACLSRGGRGCVR